MNVLMQTILTIRSEAGTLRVATKFRLTSCQVRAARAMLMFSINDLAKHSNISASSIRRMEVGFGVPENVSLDLMVKIQDYFEGRGFVFLWDKNHGPGVAWPNYLGGKKAGTEDDNADPAGGPF